MTTRTLTHRYCSKNIILTGDRMSGDTYPIKSIIKNNFDGIWDAATKSWIVNIEKVEQAIGSYLSLVIETAPTAAIIRRETLCPHCHTYCYGDCRS